MTGLDKEELYRRIDKQLKSLLDSLTDPVAIMASTAAVLHQAIPYSSWTGFYRVVGPQLLRIGPYQGPVGCLEIPFEKGVCGAAARREETQLVPDVHAFPGHIACDDRARSEIVVPVFDRNRNLYAVLDLDSHNAEAFDENDRNGLERVAEFLSTRL